jgi:hypothetical protein
MFLFNFLFKIEVDHTRKSAKGNNTIVQRYNGYAVNFKKAYTVHLLANSLGIIIAISNKMIILYISINTKNFEYESV